MSYNPTQWSAGDIVTSAKLNKIEQGISNNGFLEINIIMDTETGSIRLDRTWQEIYNANNSVIIISSGSEEYPMRAKVICAGANENSFIVMCAIDGLVVFSTTNPNDYPTINNGGNASPVAN